MATSNYPKNGVNPGPNNSIKKQSVKKKKKRPADYPKHPRNAYLFFSTEVRKKRQEEFPDKSFVELTTLVAGEWRNLKSSKKKKYEEMAKKDRARYKRELSEWKSKHASEESESESESRKKRRKRSRSRRSESESEESRSKSTKKKKKTKDSDSESESGEKNKSPSKKKGEESDDEKKAEASAEKKKSSGK